MRGLIAAASAACTVLLLMSSCDSPGSPDNDTTQCNDQSYANLNDDVGRLAERLYDLDIARLLLVKGATDRFETTVSSHDSSYTKQEIYDVFVSAILHATEADSIRSVLDRIGEASDSLGSDADWATRTDLWIVSIEEAVASSESVFTRVRTRMESLTTELAVAETTGEAIAIACEAGRVAPSFETLDLFAASADDRQWADLFPQFAACAHSFILKSWGAFLRDLVESAAPDENLFLGPVGLETIDELSGSEPGWSALAPWTGGEGSIRIEHTGTSAEGRAVAVLIPGDAGRSGSYFRPYHMSQGVTISKIPAGSYKPLLFASGFRPSALPAVTVTPGETAVLQPQPAPFDRSGCTLTGGDLPVTVFNPEGDEHLSNDFTLQCRTEIWSGDVIVQMTLADQTEFRIRSTGTFRAAVSCDDRSVEGEGTGSITVHSDGSGDCTALSVSPDRFTFTVGGARSEEAIILTTTLDREVTLLTIECPGDSTRIVDITDLVLVDREVVLTTENPLHGEVTFPIGSDLEDPICFHTSADRDY